MSPRGRRERVAQGRADERATLQERAAEFELPRRVTTRPERVGVRRSSARSPAAIPGPRSRSTAYGKTVPCSLRPISLSTRRDNEVGESA